jgi:hypothetical protein
VTGSHHWKPQQRIFRRESGRGFRDGDVGHVAMEWKVRGRPAGEGQRIKPSWTLRPAGAG